MQPKNLFLIILLVTCCFINGAADSYREPPKTPWEPYESLWYVLTTNDGFGYPLGTECDDLRTFGLVTGLYTDPFFVALDFHSLMNRAYAVEEASRVDELRLNTGYTGFDWDWPLFTLNVTPGLGLLFFGDLGTGTFQSGFHNNFHLAEGRSMPLNYDVPAFYGLAFLSVDLAENFLHMFDLKIHSQLLHNLNFTTDFTLGYWIVKKNFQIDYSATYSLNHTGSFSPAARATYAAENGLWLNSTVMAGYLFIERNINLQTYAPAGALGFRFDGSRPPVTQDLIRCSYSLHGTFGYMSNIEMLRVHPLSFFPNLSLFLRIQKHEDYNTYRKMFRLNVSSCGADLSLFDPADRTYFNPFIYAGYGFVAEKIVTNDLFRDRALEQAGSRIMHFGCGSRIKLGDICNRFNLFDFENFDFGLEFAWNFRITFGEPLLYKNPSSSVTYGFYISQ